RRRFQSVVTLVFKVLPEVSSFMRFRSPCRDKVPFVVAPVGVDHGDLQPVQEADGVDPRLPVIEAIIFPLNRRPVKNALCILERDSMSPGIDGVLVWVPGKSHVYLHFILTMRQARSLSKGTDSASPGRQDTAPPSAALRPRGSKAPSVLPISE